LDSGYRADVSVEEAFILELKSVEQIQASTRLNCAHTCNLPAQTGLIINFNTKRSRDGIKRFVL
jgi:GxxExxY protein